MCKWDAIGNIRRDTVVDALTVVVYFSLLHCNLGSSVCICMFIYPILSVCHLFHINKPLVIIIAISINISVDSLCTQL